MARQAEAVGFDSLWVVDHLLMRFGGEYEKIGRDTGSVGVWEGWSLLAALAASTARVELGTLVVCTGFRNPALLAKMAATVDEISDGRLILGLGAGWHELEYRAFGYPFDHRVGRFAEALTIIVTLLREGEIDFTGTYYDAHDCVLSPRGPRPAGPPLLIGSTRPRMLELVARFADLWNAWLVWEHSDPSAVPPLQERVDDACVQCGRLPSTLGRTLAVRVDFSGHEPRSDGTSRPLTGTTEELAESCRQFAREGIAHLQLLLTPTTPACVARIAPVLELLDHG